MRVTHRCRRCDGIEILFVANVADATDARDVDAWRIVAVQGDAAVTGAYACRACGYVELYVRDAPALARSGLLPGTASGSPRFPRHRRDGETCRSCSGQIWMLAPAADWIGGWLRDRAVDAELEQVGGTYADVEPLWVYLCAGCGLADLHAAQPPVLSSAKAQPCTRCRAGQYRLERLPDRDGNTVRQRRLVRLPPTGALDRSSGALEADVCTGCGFVTLWVEHPADIPVDGVWVTLLESVAPSGSPFR